MAFHWQADDGPTLNAGLVALWFKGIRTSIAKEPYVFCNFPVGGPPVPPLDPHMPCLFHLSICLPVCKILVHLLEVAKDQTSLHILAATTEPLLLAHTKYGCR